MHFSYTGKIFLKRISKVRFLEKEKEEVEVVASLKSPSGRNSWGRKARRVAGEDKASPMALLLVPFLKPQFLYLCFGLILEYRREM